MFIFYHFRWRGDYGTDKQHWFPANYVEEIDGADDGGDTSDLGSLQKGSIDLKNSIIGKASHSPILTFTLQRLEGIIETALEIFSPLLCFNSLNHGQVGA